MTADAIQLSDCRPHGTLLGPHQPIRIAGKLVIAPRSLPAIENYEFIDCNFDQCDLDGVSFADCIFRGCSFRNANLHSTYFWNSQFTNCVFAHGSWIHTGFRDTRFQDCSFLHIELETGAFIACTFASVTWDGGSITCSYFDYCTLVTTSFNEAVVNAVLRDCTIGLGAFDHLVEGDSCVTISSSGDALLPLEAEPTTRRSKAAIATSLAGRRTTSHNVVRAKGQDPLQTFRIEATRPTRAQLDELDRLLETETNEKHFQLFLERNPELLTVAVELGHHGIYVLREVPFGKRHRADFMVGAKNSMGHFWTGLEIESPRHKVLKANGHFTQKVQHAIDQVLGWKNYVRTNRSKLQRSKTQQGEGLIGIEPDFKAWIIIGRDPNNLSANERRARFLDSTRNIHVQTWDGFRNRIATAIEPPDTIGARSDGKL